MNNHRLVMYEATLREISYFLLKYSLVIARIVAPIDGLSVMEMMIN